MIQLVLDFETVSPLFLGGADQRPEMRAASIKGALRWWYRAVDPRFADPDGPNPPSANARRNVERLPIREHLLFGGTDRGAGQARFLIRVEPFQAAPLAWDDGDVKRFDEGYGKETLNGLRYFGYPFGMGENRGRAAIPAGTSFRVHCVMPRPPQRAEHRRAVLASWWLLGTLGGLGSRSRRGFGSLMLKGGKVAPLDGDRPSSQIPIWRDDLESLPLAATQSTPAGWRAAVSEGVEMCRHWLNGDWNGAQHAHLGEAFQWRLVDDGFDGERGWEGALHHAGKLMQTFRRRYEPDYSAVKAHPATPLRYTPDRATFGLPLSFRSGPVFVPSGIQHEREDYERHASLLLVKLVAIGGQMYPLFVRMSGAVPGNSPTATVRGNHRSARLQPPQGIAMDAFLDTVESRSKELIETSRAVFRRSGPAKAPTSSGLSPGDRVEAELLGEKTKKGGWRAREPSSGGVGHINNSQDVPDGKRPGDRVTLIVAVWKPHQKAFRYPSEADEDRQKRAKAGGKPRRERGR